MQRLTRWSEVEEWAGLRLEFQEEEVAHMAWEDEPPTGSEEQTGEVAGLRRLLGAPRRGSGPPTLVQTGLWGWKVIAERPASQNVQ